VTVHELALLSCSVGLVRLRIICSAGFYVRSLAHDLGLALGCGAHLAALRRTKAGTFSVEQAATLAAIEAEGTEAAGRLMPPDELLGHMPAVRLSEEGTRRATHGNVVGPAHLTAVPAVNLQPARVRLIDPLGRLVAVADRLGDGSLHPVVVLV
jgi:tRNA pseudouridine55 synthase